MSKNHFPDVSSNWLFCAGARVRRGRVPDGLLRPDRAERQQLPVRGRPSVITLLAWTPLNIDFLSQVDRRLQDLAAPVINRVARAAHQLVQGWTLWLRLNIHVAVECSNIVPSWRVTPKCEVQTLRKEDWQSKCSYGWQRNTMKRIVKQERLYLTVSITYIDQKSSVKEELEYKLC